MYETHYGLTEPPFSLTPDPRYFYRSATHNRVFELLKYGIKRGEGFMLLYGGAGAGKTTICRTVLDSIDNNISTALLLNPFLSETDLLKAILADFGVPTSNPRRATKEELIDALTEFLLFINEKGCRAVVLLDEAQSIPWEVLKELRALSTLEINKQRPLQVVLAGQPNLLEILSKPSLQQLSQGIAIRCELAVLSQEEVADYLRHRLAVAGASATSVCFMPDGVKEIFEYSGGIPRLINLIADRSLLAGMTLDVSSIGSKTVTEAAKALGLAKLVSFHPNQNRLFRYAR